ncbi:MAG: PTS system mannose/fructose/sorbose family transporter subunit IID [Syntrophales bacterium]|nr:PTS system mannose/fructose/sorbose family transporter subunit IID [Syntrophales bacterium]
MKTVQDTKKQSREDVPTPDQTLPCGQTPMGICVLLKIFLSSLFIQSSFNYRGMQNMGFAFSMLPLARRLGRDRERIAALLIRHLQLFNTHPYLSGPIIGSVVRMEESDIETGNDDTAATADFKNALMGPYAALGDSFFWGALKPFSSVFSVFAGLQQSLLAPLVFLLLYNPAHLWIRIKGFVEGYRYGREGINFIKRQDLPQLTGRIRWFSLAGLGSVAVIASRYIPVPSLGFFLDFFTKVVFLSLVLLCHWGIKNGISQVKMFYGIFIMGCVFSF